MCKNIILDKAREKLLLDSHPNFGKIPGGRADCICFISEDPATGLQILKFQLVAVNPYHSLTTSEPIQILTMINISCQRSNYQYNFNQGKFERNVQKMPSDYMEVEFF